MVGTKDQESEQWEGGSREASGEDSGKEVEAAGPEYKHGDRVWIMSRRLRLENVAGTIVKQAEISGQDAYEVGDLSVHRDDGAGSVICQRVELSHVPDTSPQLGVGHRASIEMDGEERPVTIQSRDGDGVWHLKARTPKPEAQPRA